MFRNLYAEEARRNQNNITMGKMLGMDPVTYSREKKNGNFTVTEAKKLLEFFGVSFEYLFKTEETKNDQGN
jgi:transcriptional regulator with XRE-family HTH domain